MYRIPIKLMLRPGFENAPESFISPIIELEISATPIQSHDGSYPDPIRFKINALIDTGADTLMVDTNFLKKIGAACVGVRGSVIQTIHGESEVLEYDVCLWFHERQGPARTYVSSHKIARNSKSYEMILGMDFIRTGKLVIDPKGESYFESSI